MTEVGLGEIQVLFELCVPVDLCHDKRKKRIKIL